VNENRLPREMITKTSLMNAAIALSATAASTNAILHLLAIATEAGVYDFDIDAFDTISRTTPVIGDLKPGGKYMAYDLYAAGGSALIALKICRLSRGVQFLKKLAMPRKPKAKMSSVNLPIL